MRASEGLKIVQELLGEEKSVKLLACEIVDLLLRHEKGEKLLVRDKLILGLRFSEFLADEDYDVLLAATKQQEYLNRLGITWDELYEETEKLFEPYRKEVR